MIKIAKIFKLSGKRIYRRYLIKHCKSKTMQDFLAKPFADKNSLISELDIVSIDLETTGLDPVKDKLVSIGLVDISNKAVRLETCWHKLVKVNKNLNEDSIVIHHITDDQSASGENIETLMPQLLEHLSGKVLLAHNAKVETGFINKVCQSLYQCDFIMPVIDTQQLAKRSLDRKNKVYKSNDLRLFNLRKQYNMPAYKAHNALMDAIATAELFLAMAEKISPGKNARLKEFLC